MYIGKASVMESKERILLRRGVPVDPAGCGCLALDKLSVYSQRPSAFKSPAWPPSRRRDRGAVEALLLSLKIAARVVLTSL